MTEKHDAKQKLTELLDRFDVAMLVTRTTEGELRARPMAVAGVFEPGDVTFVSALDTAKVDEIARDPRVCVTFNRAGAFASLSGHVHVRQEPERARAVWQPSWNAWFPEGADTEDLCLLEVRATTGELWNLSPQATLRYVFEAGKALLQGERVDPKRLGDHETVDVRPS